MNEPLTAKEDPGVGHSHPTPDVIKKRIKNILNAINDEETTDTDLEDNIRNLLPFLGVEKKHSIANMLSESKNRPALGHIASFLRKAQS